MKCDQLTRTFKGFRREPKLILNNKRLPMVDKPTLVRSWMVTLFPSANQCEHWANGAAHRNSMYMKRTRKVSVRLPGIG